MDTNEWFQLLQQQLIHTSLTEWLVTGFGIAEVLLARRNSIWLYPTGIISVLLSMYLMLDVHLYAEGLLNTYYLVMSIYGWVAWGKAGPGKLAEISACSRQELLTAVLISGAGFLVLALLLGKYTDSDVPYWDAFVSSTAWAGMWLLARRKIENWIFLNISNFFAVPLFLHKKLILLALLTIILFIVAVSGYFDWRKKLPKKTAPSAL